MDTVYGPANPSHPSTPPQCRSADPTGSAASALNGARAGPAMGANAGAMGMMQNNGMAHMPGGETVPACQTPYSSSPYRGNMPASPGGNISFMPKTSNALAFPMNTPNMNPQHQAQRMQPPPSSSTPTQPGPRASSFAGNVTQNTPPTANNAQPQFSTP